MLIALMLLTATPAEAPRVGDPIHGRSLFIEHCGAAAARSPFDPARWTAQLDDQLHQMFSQGMCRPGSKEAAFDGDAIDFLDAWDMVAFAQTRYLGLRTFFPQASRYIHKAYTIDKFGQDRLKSALGQMPRDLTHRVYTFFELEGEAGNVRFVPQDPILLDELNKDMKMGYLVYVPFRGQSLAVAVDEGGTVRKLAVHRGMEDAESLNAQLAQFEGLGKLGNTEAFDPPGRDPALRKLAQEVHGPYLTAMEAVTMYIREERDRTWGE